MRGAQRGLSILFVAVLLLAVAGATLAFLALTRTRVDVDRGSDTGVHLARVQAALEQFASASERLPCPANPALDTGDAEPNAPTAACTYPAGTVPWRTIGLRREDSLDAWGWKISYRVFGGATGLTQAKGASMVDCDTVEPSPAGTDANGRCKASHDTTEAQYLSGKGLAVNDFGTAITNAAYVLVSHGASGLGAYTTAGSQKPPNPANVDEVANLGATGPFIARAAMTSVAPEDAAHFDDVVAYRRLPDFVKRANLSARDWPEPPPPPPAFADLTFDSATVSAALGSSVSPGDTGRSTISFNNASVTAFNSGGTQDVSFSSSGSTEGIGGTIGTPLLSSAAGEGVRIDLPLKARQLAVTFVDFGRRTGNVHEQVEFKFYDAGAPVFTVVGDACKNDGGNIATFSYDAGVDFDRVDITALPATNDGSATEFLFAQLKSCAPAIPCKTSLSAASNLCS